MPSQFKITFPVPQDKRANATLVIPSDTLEEDTTGSTPSGPIEALTSPVIAIDTTTGMAPDPGTGVSETLVYPDVQIQPIATSTTGQPDIVYTSASTGVIFTWTEPVTNFTHADIQVHVDSDVAGATATVTNFRGAQGSTSYTAQLNFPPSGTGTVILTVPINAAESVATGNDGPLILRTRSFAFNFADGVLQPSAPLVEIQVPARVPFIGERLPITFVWNTPVQDFTSADVRVTATQGTPTLGAITPTSNPQQYQTEVTLPTVSGQQTLTVQIIRYTVTSTAGVPGPPCLTTKTIAFRTPVSTLGGVPAGTTLICQTEATVDTLDTLSTLGITGGAFYGVTDLTKVGNNLFGVVQVRKRRAGRTNELADSLEAGAALFRVNLTTNQCTILKAYPRILEAARSLVAHTEDLWWFEGSGYLYTVGFGADPINNPNVGNLGKYDIAGQCVTQLGKVWRTALGRQFGTTFQKDFGVAGGTFSPMLSDGTNLYALPGSGNVDFINYAVHRRFLYQRRCSPPPQPQGLTFNTERNTLENLGRWQLAQPPDDENQLRSFGQFVYVQEVEVDMQASPPRVRLVGAVTRLNDDFTGGDAVFGIPTASTGDSIAAAPENWPLLRYGPDILPRLSLLDTNELSAWDFLLQLARITQCILAFQNQLLFFKPRLPVQAYSVDSLRHTDTRLPFRLYSLNQPMPTSGLFVIGQEVIAYTGSTGTTLTGLQRGQAGTNTFLSFPQGSTLTLIQHVLTEQVFANPIEEISIESDGINIYNSIDIRFDNGQQQHTLQDADSIALHGERVFRIDAPFLDRHQVTWVRWIATHTLNTFKDLQQILRLQLHSRVDLQIGDYVYLAVPRDDIRRVGLITRIIYSSTQDIIDVELRTITITDATDLSVWGTAVWGTFVW